MPKTILITGAGSGFGEAAAIGMAKKGHDVIATVQVSPQVTPLREKAKSSGLTNLQGREARPARSLRRRLCPEVRRRRAVEQCRHRRERAGLRNPTRSRPPQLRGQRVPPLGPDPGLREGVDRARRSRRRSSSPRRWAACSRRPTGASTCRPSTRWNRSPRRCSRNWRLRDQGPDHQSRRLSTPATTRPWPTPRSAGWTTPGTSPSAPSCVRPSMHSSPRRMATSTRRR